MIVPAVIEDRVVGSLNVTRAEPEAFSEEDLSVLKEVASLLAVALQQARYRRELVRAKEEAEEMSRLKSAFLANMSHEVRTPLTSILGFSELLADRVDGEAQELLRMIRRSGNRLRETLTSVLELAELESGSKTIELEPVDVISEVEEAVDMMRPRAVGKGLAIGVDAPAERIRALADRRAFGRVLVNLLSNAVKFTEEGSVTVRVACPEDDEVIIEVADTGIGIAPEFLPRLFEEFKQESEGMARDYEGAGLGLPITRQLMELMGGAIEVDSTKGEGSVFTLRLPAPAA